MSRAGVSSYKRSASIILAQWQVFTSVESSQWQESSLVLKPHSDMPFLPVCLLSRGCRNSRRANPSRGMNSAKESPYQADGRPSRTHITQQPTWLHRQLPASPPLALGSFHSHSTTLALTQTSVMVGTGGGSKSLVAAERGSVGGGWLGGARSLSVHTATVTGNLCCCCFSCP